MPIKPTPFKSPVQFLAFGFGSGLAPKAPGTFGTLAAIPIYWFIAEWPPLHYAGFILVTAILGIWICGAASKQLGVHDHGGIVWDEFVGYWITMWAVPVDLVWIAAGLVAFRVFDIVKPWPIGWLDKKVSGGFGIMVDDIVAGVMACITLHIVLAIVGY